MSHFLFFQFFQLQFFAWQCLRPYSLLLLFWRITASPETCQECHQMKEHWEPTGEMLAVTTLKYQVLVWDFHQEMKIIGIGAYTWTKILHDSLICAASLIQSTLQCFDRILLVEIASKLSSNVTFSYSTNYTNEKCVLPMRQKFEVNKPSPSSIL